MSSDPARRGNLLDTHAILWTIATPHLLSASARRAIAAGPNFLSVISYWEVTIKSMKGRMDVGDVRAWWTDALEVIVATPILLQPRHVETLATLPPSHKDPFDRILIAQAMVEGLALVSMDRDVAAYASKRLRVVS